MPTHKRTHTFAVIQTEPKICLLVNTFRLWFIEIYICNNISYFYIHLAQKYLFLFKFVRSQPLKDTGQFFLNMLTRAKLVLLLFTRVSTMRAAQ